MKKVSTKVSKPHAWIKKPLLERFKVLHFIKDQNYGMEEEEEPTFIVRVVFIP